MNIYVCELPWGVKALCRMNEDGTYTVLLNSRNTYEDNVRSYAHEIKHILNNDFDYDVNIESVETR